MLYDALSGLEVSVERYGLERRELVVSGGLARVTTAVVLEGGGLRGHGEDVAYDPADQAGHPENLPLAGRWSFDELSRHLGGLDLFPLGPPRRPSARDYRRWAFEAAALDLALRQAGVSLGEALGLQYRPVRFVVSTRLAIEPWLAIDPELEFKLDPTPEWTAERMRALAATGRVRVLDLKGYHQGTEVDNPPDPELYRAVAEAFPEAILEDPAWTEATRAALAGHEPRIAWDAPIHSAADLDRLPFAPRALNIKPSRFGSARELFDCLDACRERRIACYGGGQFELGPGRAQIQALASLFYPDAPSDVAPGAYNEPEPRPGLPRSPLEPPADRSGFGFA
ncbi:MAG TPA: hypothetical protein VM737_09605 [Gemmatimonadota bacterium]|nr:hypothetical protein [Gemmatimonadota bacterium]